MTPISSVATKVAIASMNSALSGGDFNGIIEDAASTALSEDTIKGAVKAVVVAGVGSYLNTSGISNYRGGSMTSRMIMSGTSASITTGNADDFWTGAAAGVIPADMWMGDTYMGSEVGNTLVTAAREYTRGYIIGGDEIGKKYLEGAVLNNTVGHIVGYLASGKAPKFKNGVWIYDTKDVSEVNFSAGNAVSVNKGEEGERYEHEVDHSQFQDVLGPNYLPLHIINQLGGGKVAECPGAMPNDDGGYKCSQ